MYELTNKKLVTQTKLIQSAIDSGAKSTLKIARIMAKVKRDEIYKDDFNSVTEYGAVVFGYKPDTVSKMCALGERFVKDDFTTIFDTDTVKFSSAQLIELLPLTDDEIKALPNITGNETTKELRAKVKDYRLNKDNNADTDSAKPSKPIKTRKPNYAKMAEQLVNILPHMTYVLPLLSDTVAINTDDGEVVGYDFEYKDNTIYVSIEADIVKESE